MTLIPWLVLSFFSPALAQSAPKAFDWDSIKYVYAFGDSYSFVQGTQGHANFSFIGDNLKPSFTPDELLSNEIVAKNTSSEGSNWLEFVTGCFEGLPSNCERQLWDFAFAGADIDAAILPRHHDYTLQLVEEVDQWIQFASGVIPHPDGETLTAWWIGINDTGDTVKNSSITDFRAFWEIEMTSYFNAVQRAHDNGLKAHLFLNVPAEERSPSNVNSSNKAIIKAHIQLYNEVMTSHMENFASRNQDATVLFFDTNAFFNVILDNFQDHGFQNATGACNDCTNPRAFFWYNAGHPTQEVHRLLAEAIETQLRG